MDRAFWTMSTYRQSETNLVTEGSNTLTVLARDEFEGVPNNELSGWTQSKSGVYLAHCPGRTQLFLLTLSGVFVD